MEDYILQAAEKAAEFTREFKFYFYLAPFIWLALLVVFLILGATFKRFRYADKKIFTSITLSLAFSHTGAALNASGANDAKPLSVSMLVFAVCFALCGALIAQSELKIRLTLREKRLIGRLSSPKGEAEGNIRRIEFLGSKQDENLNIEPNFNEIIAIINKLRREEITTSEEDELDKTEMDMEKFSSRSPTPFERRVFSDRLLKIVKMMSKYNIAN